MIVTVKNFTIDTDKQTFKGPQDYMQEEGNKALDAICAGKDETFNMFQHESPNFETAICVWMQTYYAGWKGRKQAEKWCS